MKIKNIKVFFFLFLILLISSNFMLAQKSAYQLFDSKGKRVKYKKILKATRKYDVVFLGEYHNNPISHWLQLEIIRDCYREYKAIQLGAEMFETHQQWALDLYLSKKIDYEAFVDTVKLWPNYGTDYDPIVDFAREHQISFFATNIPRQYARLVNKQGLSALDTIKEKKLVAPLPITVDYTSPAYRKMTEMMGEKPIFSSENIGNLSENTKKFIAAQAVKDATMAYRIASNFQSGAIFFHLNGSFHSDYHDGIIGYLKKNKPGIKILTLTTVEQPEVKKLSKENHLKADYIIVVPESMTKTYR